MNTTSKTICFHRLRSVLLGAGLFAFFCAAAHATEVLFTDDFQAASTDKTLDDLNNGAQDRQQGALAPVAYLSNGAGWQCKTNVGSSGSGSSGIRLYPSAYRIPLVLSPAWKLSEEPGEYSLALQIQPRSWKDSEGPEKILIALGAGEQSGTEGEPPRSRRSGCAGDQCQPKGEQLLSARSS